MNSKLLKRLRDDFTNEGIQICFNGSFSHSIIEELGKAVKQYLEDERAEKNAVMDVFSIFIEQTQNVQHYTSRSDLPKSDGVNVTTAIVVIGKADDKYWISSGNPVAKAHISDLTGHLDMLNGLDKQELKALYKQQLRKELPDSSRGAGLGLIDIARKMSSPFHYSIEELDDQYVFFGLKVTI